MYRKIYKTSALISGLAILNSISGLVREAVMAYLFGASRLTDIVLVAFMLPNLLYTIFLGNALSAGFIPIVVDSGDGDKSIIFSSFLNSSLIYLFILTSISIALTPYMVSFSMPGFKADVYNDAVAYTKVMFPMILLVGISSIVATLLNAKKMFISTSIGTFLQSLFFILTVAVLFPVAGGMSLLVGTYAGAFAMLLFLCYVLVKSGTRYLPATGISDLSTINIWRLMLPIIITMGVGGEYGTQYVDVLLARYFASSMGVGAITALSYANKIMAIPIMLITFSLATVMLPYTAELYSKQDLSGLRDLFQKTICALLLILIPVSILFWSCSENIVSVLLHRGAFDDNAVKLTAKALEYFSPSIVGISMSTILMRFLFSMRQTNMPVIIGVVTVLTNAIFMALFTKMIGFEGIPLAISLGSVMNALFLYFALKLYIKETDIVPVKFALKVSLSIVTMFVVVMFMKKNPYIMKLSEFYSLALLATVGLFCYIIVLYILKLKEFMQFVVWLQGRCKKSV